MKKVTNIHQWMDTLYRSVKITMALGSENIANDRLRTREWNMEVCLRSLHPYQFTKEIKGNKAVFTADVDLKSSIEEEGILNETTLDTALSTLNRVGNCQQYSSLILLQFAILLNENPHFNQWRAIEMVFDFLDHNIVLFEKKEFDNIDDNEKIICDPWVGGIFTADDFPSYFKLAVLKVFFEEQQKLNLCIKLKHKTGIHRSTKMLSSLITDFHLKETPLPKLTSKEKHIITSWLSEFDPFDRIQARKKLESIFPSIRVGTFSELTAILWVGKNSLPDIMVAEDIEEEDKNEPFALWKLDEELDAKEKMVPCPHYTSDAFLFSYSRIRNKMTIADEKNHCPAQKELKTALHEELKATCALKM